MKTQYCFLFCLALTASLPAQTTYLTISPAQPKPGETVRFEYHLSQSPLNGVSEDIEAAAFEFSGKTPEAKDLTLQYSGDKITGSFTLSPEAQVAMLDFKAGEHRDNNKGEGYFISLYQAPGKILPQSWAAQAVMYRDWGSLFELNRKTTAALDLLSKAFAAKPELRHQYFAAYITNLLAVKRGDAGKAEAQVMLEDIENTAKLEEKDWIAVARLYDRLSMSEKSGAVRDKIRKNYPKGVFVRQERRQAMRNEPDLTKQEAMLEAYLKDFPPTTAAEKEEMDEAYFALGNKSAEKKNWTLFNKVTAQMQPESRADLFNNIAWEMAENDEELEMARKMAAEATEWAKLEMTAPKKPKPSYDTYKSWEQERKYTFGQYADTYAFILDKLNDPNTAAAYQVQVVDIFKGENVEMNERLARYLERANAPDLRYRLEGFILHNQATTAMKEQFKRLFTTEDKSTAGADAYMAGLEKLARANQKKSLAAKMLNQPAPGFSLKNLNGEEVSLESLKGKVVVLDFWATWCGPCKASFPGMQQAQNKFKDDPNVQFLFVDTWERVEDKAKAAGDFIQSKGYPFHVLLDLEDKVVASYGVSGIPTKFVVDKNGKIRFKSIGYSGSAETLVDELTAMIELAKEQP